jgi:hypothetical protein
VEVCFLDVLREELLQRLEAHNADLPPGRYRVEAAELDLWTSGSSRPLVTSWTRRPSRARAGSTALVVALGTGPQAPIDDDVGAEKEGSFRDLPLEILDSRPVSIDLRAVVAE